MTCMPSPRITYLAAVLILCVPDVSGLYNCALTVIFYSPFFLGSASFPQCISPLLQPAPSIYGILLYQAAKDVNTSPDALVKCIENLLKRLKIDTEAPLVPLMTEVLVKIMLELLLVFALATNRATNRSLNPNHHHACNSDNLPPQLPPSPWRQPPEALPS